jgi:hypothetical protein
MKNGGQMTEDSIDVERREEGSWQLTGGRRNVGRRREDDGGQLADYSRRNIGRWAEDR